MQFSKLKVGSEYLVSHNTDWREYASSGLRMRLESLTRFAKPYRWSVSEQVAESPKGKLVKMTDVSTGETYYSPVHHIRGEWSVATAEQDTVVAARKLAADQAEASEALLRAHSKELVQQAERLGLVLTAKPDYTRETNTRETYSRSRVRGFTYEMSSADLGAWIERMHAEGHDRGNRP